MPVNTAALKTFAPAMRRQLLEAVGRKLDLLLNSQTPDTLSTYVRQIAELREQEADDREQLLERVAYTWFNRLCALRYLDARGWHPFGCKVLMPAAEGETQPELLKLMRAGSLPAALKGHANESRLHGLLDGQIQTAIAGADPQGEVYRELLLTTCRFYHELLPNIFEGLNDASELLLPDDLLSEGSIAGSFRREISDDDCQVVEILGWLYQFYISEKKDEVMARKKAVPTEDIPSVTQLFTPHWIVRYLVENSLGRLWLLNRPGSKLREQMPYYIEGEAETDFLKINKPEEIKVLDPACGSGHMLTYAFDLLTLIYEEEGYAPSEIPGLILRHNLHGLEICPRAAQLAELALVFKAREQSRRFFQAEPLLQTQVLELKSLQLNKTELDNYINHLNLGGIADQKMLLLLHQFEDAKAIGSLIRPSLDSQSITEFFEQIQKSDLEGHLTLGATHCKLVNIRSQAIALAKRYHIVIANPPYMGGVGINAVLRQYMKSKFQEYANDLYASFMARNIDFTANGGFVGMMTPFTWMYLSSFEDIRKRVLLQCDLMGLVKPQYHTLFESAAVPVCAFYICKRNSRGLASTFFDLEQFKNRAEQAPRLREAIADNKASWRYDIPVQNLQSIPGMPLAFSLSEGMLKTFDSDNLGKHCKSSFGIKTGNNDKFLLGWHEVSASEIDFSATGDIFKKRWYPCASGGKFRRWYGNSYFIVDYQDAGRRIQKYAEENGNSYGFNGSSMYFKRLITWPKLTSSKNSFRATPGGHMFDGVGLSAKFESDKDYYHALLATNSAVINRITPIIAPTMSLTIGDFNKLPFLPLANASEETAQHLIKISKADWDDYEVSWEFKTPSILDQRSVNCLKSAYLLLQKRAQLMVAEMKGLEEKNNASFILAYGLEEELSPEVPIEEISIKANPAYRYDSTLSSQELADRWRRDSMYELLSFAIGCMMGRYSLDQPGLILADSRDSQSSQLAAYEEKLGKPLSEVQFKPDSDGIIPVLDGEWFEDDIVSRTREFLQVTFPESTVTENLRFIEESLGKDVRKYFCTEFYKDHLQTYKKRPIYWMVQSPSGPAKGGFACLIYLHRYTKDTLNQVLNNYFRPYLQKLEARLAQLGLDQLNDSLPTRERTAARKEAEKITKVIKECQSWEQDALLPLAQQRIELDLDDGVKVNYLKLQDVLAPIPGLASKED